MIDPNSIQIGNVIMFRSIAVNDNNNYYGKVIGMNTSELAKSYADIYTYNANVRTTDGTVPDTDQLSFLMIQLMEQLTDGSNRYLIPFAKEWISLPTLQIVAANKAAIIKVYEIDATNIQNVIDLLRTGGFKARLESLV